MCSLNIKAPLLTKASKKELFVSSETYSAESSPEDDMMTERFESVWYINWFLLSLKIQKDLLHFDTLGTLYLPIFQMLQHAYDITGNKMFDELGTNKVYT